MDEQSKFKEALASVTIRAEENGGKLSAEEAKELLKDMEFNDEQMVNPVPHLLHFLITMGS